MGTMQRRLIFRREVHACCLLFATLGLSVSGAGQSIALPSAHTPQKVALRIRLFTADGKQPIRNVRAIVQLMDGFGTMQGEKPVDAEGMVDLSTTWGLHRIRVFGPTIEEYTGQFEIGSFESDHLEMLRIAPKAIAATDADLMFGHDTAAMVNVTRLNIPEQAKRHFKKGSEEMQKHRWQEARAEFEAAVASYPKFDLAFNGLGVAAYLGGDPVGAGRAFEQAISINQHFAGAYRNLARIYLAEHDWARAEELLAKALQNEPANVWALTNDAYAELQLKQFDRALATAHRVHSFPHEGFANAHYIAALALEGLQQGNEALAEYELYLREAPDGPNAGRAREAVERLQLGAAIPR